MSKDKNKKINCDCDDDCDCGCQDGKECTCNDKHCNCECHSHKHEKNCGCLDGKECTCGDDCDCGCHEHKHEKNCGCLDGKECTCGDDCDCGEDCDCDDHCDCGCHEDHCDCGCHDQEANPEFMKYEMAFRQLEDALIKVDKELEATKKVAEENERLAITYKKDLERYKERTKDQESAMQISAVSNIADKLIPILDSFEQALKVTGDPSVMKGFEMVEGMLKNAVKALGIEEIDALNAPFDPNLHNAVAKKKTKDKNKADTVASVYQKGYKMAGESGKVIRHSMVEIYLFD